MKSLFSFVSKKVLIYCAIVAAVVLVGFLVFNKGNGKKVVYATLTDVVQEVAATGKITPNQTVNLGFDKSGRIATSYVEVGDQVAAGQVLATLDSAEASADLSKARATLLEENIKLRELRNTAPISYNDAAKNLQASIREAFATSDNAVRNKADQFFKTPSTNPLFEVSFTDGNFVHYFNVPNDVKLDISNSRKQVEVILDDWQNRIVGLNQTNVVAEADKAISDLNLISLFLNKVASAVNTFSPAEYAYETTVTTYKTTISSARNEVSSVISDVVTAKDKLNTAPTLGVNGQFENILAQESKVAQAEAAVASLEASLGKSVIRAPFSGVVTIQDAEVGNAVSAGTTIISVISQNQMYIEANISEIQIGKITVGDFVSITLDAFPNEKFAGSVSYIEPGDVIIDGVVNYKIRVSLQQNDERIKSGLTANLKIQTAKKEGAIAIPLYAISKENDQTFVNKIVGDKSEKTMISLGLSGNNGLVEVLSGLNVGDGVEF